MSTLARTSSLIRQESHMHMEVQMDVSNFVMSRARVSNFVIRHVSSASSDIGDQWARVQARLVPAGFDGFAALRGGAG
eukprot:4154706-Pleurochrysis_carterae.AAC.1